MANPEKAPFERLPKNVIPCHYSLDIKPDFEIFKHTGKATIDIKILEKTRTIVLNSVDLEYGIIVYKNDKNEEFGTLLVVTNEEKETLELTFKSEIEPGNGQLFIEFTGEINDKMKGFYRSKYTASNGETRYNAVTQFESTDARRCFPCWDEPAIRATFDITLHVPEDRIAISNMPEENVSFADGIKSVSFKRTPVMSSYLVAFVVGEFDFIEDMTSDGVKVRVYTPLGKTEQGKFALYVATKVLPYFKDYFNVAYPLPKIDLIAVADFQAGAMENWGLVVYRETCLLVDPKNTSAIRKQWVAIIIGHELAHMWFGNLVTMEWWTHLWLKEGYANFVEFLCVDHLFPEYDIWTQFVNDVYTTALELDALKNSHPIEVPVGHPSEIDEIFDDISYNKGASVIRMLHRFIGESDFRKGMNLYLTRHQYSSAVTEDLWKALEEASGKSVKNLMSTWTKQLGFPVISITSEQKNNTRVLNVTQKKFFADPDAALNDTSLWHVPLAFSTSKSPKEAIFQCVLDSRTKTIILENVCPDDWIKVNPGTVGYYRTQYSTEMLNQLLPAIRDKSLPPLDRLGLLNDLFAMVQSGQTETAEALRVMEAYSDKEDDYTVWSSVNSCLAKLNSLLEYTDNGTILFWNFVKKLLANIHKQIGWDPEPNESHLRTLLRALVIGRLGRCGEESIIEEARKRFKLHLSGEKCLPADIRSAVYCTVAANGDKETFEAFLKLYRDTDLQEERDRLSRALGSLGDKELLQKVLDFSITGEVKAQDAVFVIGSVATSKEGRDLAWEFYKQHWATFVKQYKSGFLMTRLVKSITEDFVTDVAAKEVQEFFVSHPTPGTERAVQQSIETIHLNQAWLKRDQDKILKYLSIYDK